MNKIVYVLIYGLALLGAWVQGAVEGYVHGKSDAQNNLAPRAFVIMRPGGKCYFENREQLRQFSGPAEVVVLGQSLQ